MSSFLPIRRNRILLCSTKYHECQPSISVNIRFAGIEFESAVKVSHRKLKAPLFHES
jgi:hypothetical protein